MRAAFVIAIVLSVFILNMKEWMVIGAFHADQSEIANNYCVNQTNDPCCRGSCFLANWLIDIHDEKNNAQLVEEYERTFFLEEENVLQSNFLELTPRVHVHCTQWNSREYIRNLLDPPQV